MTTDRPQAEAASWVPHVCSNDGTTEALGYEPSKIENIGLSQMGWGWGAAEGRGKDRSQEPTLTGFYVVRRSKIYLISSLN